MTEEIHEEAAEEEVVIDSAEEAAEVTAEVTEEATEEVAEELVFPKAKIEIINGKERLIPGWKQLKEQNNK